jgi:hypothetical protein
MSAIPIVSSFLLVAAAFLSSGATDGEAIKPRHGLVGLRPIPADEAGTRHSHGGSWEGMPTFDKQKGRYPFVAEHIDTLFGWVPDGDFKTRRVFFEYYWGLSEQRDDQGWLPGRCGGVVCLGCGFPGGMPLWLAGQQVG